MEVIIKMDRDFNPKTMAQTTVTVKDDNGDILGTVTFVWVDWQDERIEPDFTGAKPVSFLSQAVIILAAAKMVDSHLGAGQPYTGQLIEV